MVRLSGHGANCLRVMLLQTTELGDQVYSVYG